ncbi:LAMI_0D04038g1_1 [Lachancea mirantina]|uniref:Acyl-CoA desaturase n=1 Tax=Lachancea mirantina TaxID=1230905 RepID=A0A1G4JAU3_9SACH|nr:LAMI_0D04038g1_1 [Lachancea mirantina]
MENGIPEFDFRDLLSSRNDAQGVELGHEMPNRVVADRDQAEIVSPKIRRRDPQAVHLLKKVSLQSTCLCVIIPLFSLFKLILAPPASNPRMLVFMGVYMLLSQVSLVAGYHRFFTHSAYQCHLMVQAVFAIVGGSCGLGSILDFSSQHLAHHRHIDTERDPHACNVHGWLFAQWGHKLFRGNRKSARAVKECRATFESAAKAGSHKDNSQLVTSPSYALLKWQDDNYGEILILTIVLIPCLLSRFCNVSYFSSIFYMGFVRMSLVQQQWLLVGSLCHMKRFIFASQPFDDSRSAVNLPMGFFSNLATFGEASHNFHHEFPGDYRNSNNRYQWDPARWAILLLYSLGFVKKLHYASQEQVDKCLLQQQQKLVDEERSKLQWGVPLDKLPIMAPERFVELAMMEFIKNKRALVAIEGVVHDVTPFIYDHPGGVALVETSIGKDATQAFNGAVYLHSQAARNLLATMRIAVLGRGPMGIEPTIWEKHMLESNNFKSDSKGREIVRNKQQVTFTNKNHYAAGAA